MIIADLHMHSQRSDGIDTIEEVFRKCHAQGIDVAAVTDHDIIPDQKRIKAAGREHGVKVLIGMECGSYDTKLQKRAHILGYHIQDYRAVAQYMEPVLERRNAHNTELIARVCEMGYPLTEAEVRSHTESSVLYRQHIIYALYQKGLIPEMWGDWYKEMFQKGGPLAIRNSYPEAEAIVRAITEGGGSAVLAHPGQQQNFELLPRLKECGLEGVELVHPSNSEKDQAVILEYADRLNLFLTGGSDYHGILSPSGGEIGAYCMRYDAIPETLRDYIC